MQKILRVVDLIVELEKHDPTAPVEVWTRWSSDGTGLPGILAAYGVQQMTPHIVRKEGYICHQLEESKALPVVVWVDGPSSCVSEGWDG